MLSFILLIRSFVRALYHALKEQPAVRGLAILTLILIATGTIFYINVEHWGVVDALYFSVTTLTTVGFGDLAPHKTVSKLFTVVYILVGVSIILGLLNILAGHALQVQKKNHEKEEAAARRRRIGRLKT